MIFRKLNIFGYEDFVDIFWDHHEGQGTEWRISFGLLKFQIFIWGA